MEWVLGIVVLLLDIFAIVSVLSSASSPERKALWVLVILLLPVIGMVLYFLIGHRTKHATPA